LDLGHSNPAATAIAAAEVAAAGGGPLSDGALAETSAELPGTVPSGRARITTRPAATREAVAADGAEDSAAGPWRMAPAGGYRTPLACIFTAYNEEECVRSCQMLDQLYGIRPDVQAAVNPFRQPLWCVGRTGNGLPSYSNGFVYGWVSV
jgi:hypothetical protein